MNKVWVTGDAVVDLIPYDETKYLKCPGGAPANVAVTIARLGGLTGFFGRVGNDPFGRFMEQVLSQEGVDTSNLVVDNNQRTSTVVVELDSTGERNFTFMVKLSADQFFMSEDIPLFSKNQWLHCCSIALAHEPSRSATLEAMKRMKAAKGYVSFDPNLRPEIWDNPEELIPNVMQAVELADMVKFSEEELLLLTKKSSLREALKLWQLCKEKLIIVTLGAQGALTLFNGEQRVIVGKTVENVVDTTGAGDAFVGGLLAKLSQNQNWKTWPAIEAGVNWGNSCGALATTKKGAMTALPAFKQLQSVMVHSKSFFNCISSDL
ncbi:aminoimidazole riboside kinase [Vibrio viridaestus]|uniref:Aminoimidazole riboside kinase n=1 Tax=Vibrio viridaestus TaxID=2487322 RepID=A0A3N9TE78_9VIBR|nr:aminoimidazole riboside kinase [Vibrio viridaestus]RQW62521.1 aminoimidazole riboside kinase [Vibrio viridaestus]